MIAGGRRADNICRIRLHEVACDLCGCRSPGLVHEEDSILMVRRDGQFYIDVRVSVCPRCGLVFLSPRMTPEELEAFYRNQLRHYPSAEGDDLGTAGRREQASYLLDKHALFPGGNP